MKSLCLACRVADLSICETALQSAGLSVEDMNVNLLGSSGEAWLGTHTFLAGDHIFPPPMLSFLSENVAESRENWTEFLSTNGLSRPQDE
jgi:hypothetical protein